MASRQGLPQQARERAAVVVLSWLGMGLARLLGAALPAASATGLGLGLGLAWLLGWAPPAALGTGAVGPGGAARTVAAQAALLALLALGAAAMALRGQLALSAYLCLLLLAALLVVRELKPARAGPGDAPAEPVQVLGRERHPPDEDDLQDRVRDRLRERRLAARAARAPEAEIGQEAMDYDDASGSGSEHESEDDALAPAAPMPLPAAPDYANMTERQIKKATRKREKAEQRLARAEAIRQSEERKASARSAYEELQALREDERLERERALEEERQAQLRQEEAQYREWRGAIRVEGGGEAADAGVRAAALDAAIVQLARLRRVLVLDDVAEDLGVRTSELLERVEGLRAAGSLRGVLDDRGKFVVVSDDDLDRLAAFVRQRGRVSLPELARHSNELVVGLSSSAA
jgi:hypothetical protein